MNRVSGKRDLSHFVWREANSIILQSIAELRGNIFEFAIEVAGRSNYAGANVHLRGGLIFVITKIWSQDGRQTIKSCACVLIIGTTVAAAMVIIRLIGEQRLQRFLNRIMNFKRRPEAEKLTEDAFLPNNQS
ncbi:MAG: hypothetical protein PVF29_01430 [Desulfobacterales bacterium]|jgi:hypothetical protein